MPFVHSILCAIGVLASSRICFVLLLLLLLVNFGTSVVLDLNVNLWFAFMYFMHRSFNAINQLRKWVFVFGFFIPFNSTFTATNTIDELSFFEVTIRTTSDVEINRTRRRWRRRCLTCGDIHAQFGRSIRPIAIQNLSVKLTWNHPDAVFRFQTRKIIPN